MTAREHTRHSRQCFLPFSRTGLMIRFRASRACLMRNPRAACEGFYLASKSLNYFPKKLSMNADDYSCCSFQSDENGCRKYEITMSFLRMKCNVAFILMPSKRFECRGLHRCAAAMTERGPRGNTASPTRNAPTPSRLVLVEFGDLQVPDAEKSIMS